MLDVEEARRVVLDETSAKRTEKLSGAKARKKGSTVKKASGAGNATGGADGYLASK